MAVLEATELTKTFGRTKALDGLSFNVEKGEIFGLIGPDGAGKTTTLRILAGVMEPDSGKVIIGDYEVSKQPEKIRECIGYMPQHFSLYADLTVAENLNFFANMYFVKKKERKERLEELFAFSRLKPFSNRQAGKLSGGMQKKLGVSCCMIHTPDLLLLDEPTTGVDPVSRRELWEILYRFAERGVAQVICTPYMDEAERCHRVGLIYRGCFLTVDAPQTIINGHDEQVYELSGIDLDQSRAVLINAAGISDVYSFGDCLHIAADKNADVKTIVENLLKQSGINHPVLAKVLPNFEDIFMARIRRASL